MRKTICKIGGMKKTEGRRGQQIFFLPAFKSFHSRVRKSSILWRTLDISNSTATSAGVQAESIFPEPSIPSTNNQRPGTEWSRSVSLSYN